MDGRGARCGPLKSWHGHATENSDAIGHAYDWWKTCKDREDSKEIIHVLVNVPSPQDRKTCNNNNKLRVGDRGLPADWTPCASTGGIPAGLTLLKQHAIPGLEI